MEHLNQYICLHHWRFGIQFLLVLPEKFHPSGPGHPLFINNSILYLCKCFQFESCIFVLKNPLFFSVLNLWQLNSIHLNQGCPNAGKCTCAKLCAVHCARPIQGWARHSSVLVWSPGLPCHEYFMYLHRTGPGAINSFKFCTLHGAVAPHMHPGRSDLNHPELRQTNYS